MPRIERSRPALKICRAVLLAAAGLAALAACSRQEQAEVPTKPAPIPTDQLGSIPVTDELGSFASEVSGLALWAHPTLAFKGGVLAANGTAGLILIDFEKAARDTVEGNFSTGVTVAYPQGALGIESVIAAHDASAGYRFFDIDPETAQFSEWQASGLTNLPENPVALCALAPENRNMIRLAVITGRNSVSIANITINNGGSLTVGTPIVVNVPDVFDCSGDDAAQSFHFLSRAGSIYSLDTGAEAGGEAVRKIAELPDLAVKGIATSLQDGQGQILVGIEGVNASFYAYDSATGERLGGFTIAPLTDIDGVTHLQTFAADGGNFGAIYRKGVIATIGGEARTLKLAPLSTALRNWDLFDAAVLDRRDITQTKSEDAGDQDAGDLIPGLNLSVPEL